MTEVSREPATNLRPGAVAEVGDPSTLAREPLGFLDFLVDDGLGDGGMHCSLLLIESGCSTAIRMN
jgi:hypothetical protein